MHGREYSDRAERVMPKGKVRQVEVLVIVVHGEADISRAPMVKQGLGIIQADLMILFFLIMKSTP